MDDGRLPVEMTLEDIAKRLDRIEGKVDGIDGKFAGIDGKFAALDKRFDAVDEQLNGSKIRDEEAHRLLQFSLEAREGLRESMEDRFEDVGRKHDQEIGLLKDVLYHVTGTRQRR